MKTLRKLIEDTGETMQSFAEKTGIAPSRIYEWADGGTLPHKRNRAKLMRHLRVTENELIAAFRASFRESIKEQKLAHRVRDAAS